MTRNGFGLTCWPNDGSKMMTAKARTITIENTNFILVGEFKEQFVSVRRCWWTECRLRCCPHIYTKKYLTDFTRDRKHSVKKTYANLSSKSIKNKGNKFFVDFSLTLREKGDEVVVVDDDYGTAIDWNVCFKPGMSKNIFFTLTSTLEN